MVIRVNGKIISGTGKVYPTGLLPNPLLLGGVVQVESLKPVLSAAGFSA